MLGIPQQVGRHGGGGHDPAEVGPGRRQAPARFTVENKPQDDTQTQKEIGIFGFDAKPREKAEDQPPRAAGGRALARRLQPCQRPKPAGPHQHRRRIRRRQHRTDAKHDGGIQPQQ